MGFGFDLIGGERLLAKLGKMAKDYEDKLEAAVTAGAKLIENDAKPRAPYKTGNLRSSIHTETAEKQGSRVTVHIGTDVVYAATQEFGDDSRNIPAHPYLRPAFDENLGRAKEEIAKAFKEAVS